MTIVQYAIAREFGRLSRLKRELTEDEQRVYEHCAAAVKRYGERITRDGK